MKLGIMQPYFMPYIGYWQLMNAVDEYVIYDDVNFIKGGWINRNRILVNGQAQYFNVPMLGASSFKQIREISVNHEERLVEKNLRALKETYQKAPYYQDVYPLMKDILICDAENLASYITNSFKVVCDYLDITTKLIVSSEIEKDCSLKGQDKVLSVCKILSATEYYNAIGGRELYSFKDFKAQEIQLKFLNTDAIVYTQFENEFQPNLSIIDVMMFNSKEQIKQMLNAYTLVAE
ncbi:MAG: WbqC family protein [Oscillospiraceae bacterium]